MSYIVDGVFYAPDLTVCGLGNTNRVAKTPSKNLSICPKVVRVLWKLRNVKHLDAATSIWLEAVVVDIALASH